MAFGMCVAFRSILCICAATNGFWDDAGLYNSVLSCVYVRPLMAFGMMQGFIIPYYLVYMCGH